MPESKQETESAAPEAGTSSFPVSDAQSLQEKRLEIQIAQVAAEDKYDYPNCRKAILPGCVGGGIGFLLGGLPGLPRAGFSWGMALGFAAVIGVGTFAVVAFRPRR